MTYSVICVPGGVDEDEFGDGTYDTEAEAIQGADASFERPDMQATLSLVEVVNNADGNCCYQRQR